MRHQMGRQTNLGLPSVDNGSPYCRAGSGNPVALESFHSRSAGMSAGP